MAYVRPAVQPILNGFERMYPGKKAADKELMELVAATGTSLLGLHGVGPSGAARLGCWSRWATCPGSLTATTSPPAGA